MFNIASTRVRALSIINCLNSSKFRQPAQPASITVVTPERKVKPSGRMLRSPA